MGNWASAKQGIGQTGHRELVIGQTGHRAWGRESIGQRGHWEEGPRRALLINLPTNQ
ncbi:MAG: hypothetical protein JGK17_17945 [Microcoleus sp. PH2017_10_PVI_O_A]|uniref:hypothetical protein n=1 Tax=unclassified Microcoleus TaxID=2642155 RepID=UPI001DE444F3|nr:MULTISPECIES: hypothetical protein [unclassified Microcoleus]MCC3407435.1 hypothetical protein [Microcoleus sp. PH2017_10_PVI_O_A]MCC3461515.1 hypothetical protein [Microcoleus sp. PH2017_11_PCY_U_A]MCC3479989.1 hypothetical protein [Microcoleus sp. PH2017_12_PCY_D_A]MCC3529795.1 hypothetical protein [Microcoleus sp. PH2017_21_RUC_O_A]MCC3560877.1 hypothetical protein [Microcoleus sp. PH2017_27_LUM_O_A]